mmetsp:Transcript_2586/g.2736  ORF Transcript_2586/g.2736 Transcript_2586/m.2736 type:complete len:218 (-) Transcript_2586:190-843(-)
MQALKDSFKTCDSSPATVVKQFWIVCLIFSGVDCIVSISVAGMNNETHGGSSGLVFAALWSLFLVIIFDIAGSQLIFYGNCSALMVGFVIGVAAMLAELFLVLMCVFFSFGTSSKHKDFETEDANNAMGAFCFFNMIIFFVFAVLLTQHRSLFVATIQNRPPVSEADKAVQLEPPTVAEPAESEANRESRFSMESIKLEDSQSPPSNKKGDLHEVNV